MDRRPRPGQSRRKGSLTNCCLENPSSGDSPQPTPCCGSLMPKGYSFHHHGARRLRLVTPEYEWSKLVRLGCKQGDIYPRVTGSRSQLPTRECSSLVRNDAYHRLRRILTVIHQLHWHQRCSPRDTCPVSLIVPLIFRLLASMDCRSAYLSVRRDG